MVRLILLDDPNAATRVDLYSNLPLHLAVRHADRIEIVRMLLRSAPHSTHTMNVRGDLPLHIAVRRGNVAIVRELLEIAPSTAIVPNDLGNTAAHLAACLAYMDILTHVARASPASLHAKNKEGMTPLQLACTAYCDYSVETSTRIPLDSETQQLPRIIMYLLERTPTRMNDLTQALQLQTPVLHAAAYLGHVQLARMIMEQDPQAIHEQDGEGSYVTHMATTYASLPILRDILRTAPFLGSVVDYRLRTPLHIAASDNHAAAASVLVEAAPQAAHMLSLHGETPLHYAAWNNSTAVARILISAAEDTLTVQDDEGRVPTMVAAYAGNMAILQMLLEAAPETIRSTDHAGMTTLHCAVETMQQDVVEMLLAEAPDLARVADSRGWTPMYLLLMQATVASQEMNTEDDVALSNIARRLLRLAPQTALEMPPNSRVPPIVRAVAAGYEKTVQAIVDAVPKAALTRGSGGMRLFDMALTCGEYPIVGILARVPGQDPASLLESLANHGAEGHAYIHEVLDTYPAMAEECWAHVPPACPGLLLAFSKVLRAGRPCNVWHLVMRMSDLDITRLMTVIQALQATGMCRDLVLRVAAEVFA